MNRSLLFALLLTVGLVPGPADAAEPRWKVHQKLSNALFLDGVETVGKDDTWFFGEDTDSGPVALHWNGKKVQRVALPPLEYTEAPVDVDFASANDGWAVSIRFRTFEVIVMHWDGKAWKIVKSEPVKTTWPQVKALGGGAALVTGSETARGEVNWIFDGKTWREEKDKLSLSAFSGRYAFAWSPKGETLARWNARRKTWVKVPVGARPKPLKGRKVTLDLLEARSDKEIWVTATRYSGRESGTTYLLRWNGRQWKRERVPLPSVHSGAYTMAADGRGGLWLVAYSTWLHEGEGRAGEQMLYHRLPNGKWKRIRGDKDFEDLALVPGTASLWGIGSYGYYRGTHALFTLGKAR